MSGVPTNRTNFVLPKEVSSEIIAKTQEQSAVMRLARQVTLPGNGMEIPVITGDPEAEWVTETGVKPISNPSLDKKVMQGHTLAVIVPFSNQFRRDVPALYDEIVRRLPGALAYKYDKTVFFGPESGTLANFDNFSGITGHSIGTSAYDGILAANIDIAEQGGIMNGIALSPQGEGVLLSALDKNDRPLFIDSVADGGIPKVLGASIYETKSAYKAGTAGSAGNPDVVGFAGDWTKAMYGVVQGVTIDFSTEATLTVTNGTSVSQINLFQQNMFAVRAEIEVGFVAQTAYFNKLTRPHSA